MKRRKNLNSLTKKYYRQSIKQLAIEQVQALQNLTEPNCNVESFGDSDSSDSAVVKQCQTINNISNEELEEEHVTSTINNTKSSESEEEDVLRDDASSSDSSENENNEISRTTDAVLRNELSTWCCESNISNAHMKELLLILQRAGHDLPSDARTLKKCKEIPKLLTVTGGSYVHFGLEDTIKYCLERNLGEIYLHFNVDGLPLSKSSNSQVWPILCYSADKNRLIVSPVFPVGIFHGYSKPVLDEYFKELIKDYTQVSSAYRNTAKIIIKSFVCDAPAKSFCTGIKNHNAYFGCSKCTQEGEYVQNRVTFPKQCASLRTDETFRQKTDEDHHNCTTPLEKLNFDMVSGFPLDYMHLICLGVVKKLLGYWVEGPKEGKERKNTKQKNEQNTKQKKKVQYRLSNRMIVEISSRIKGISDNLPFDFNRKLRPLKEYSRWKATECRSFLLYYGPFVLKGILNESCYQHFLQLSVACRILMSPSLQNKLSAAHILLQKFVTNCGIIYSKASLV